MLADFIKGFMFAAANSAAQTCSTALRGMRSLYAAQRKGEQFVSPIEPVVSISTASGRCATWICGRHSSHSVDTDPTSCMEPSVSVPSDA